MMNNTQPNITLVDWTSTGPSRYRVHGRTDEGGFYFDFEARSRTEAKVLSTNAPVHLLQNVLIKAQNFVGF